MRRREGPLARQLGFRMVRWTIGCTLLAAVLLATPGCGGCTRDKGIESEAQAQARAKAEQERRQREIAPFFVGQLSIQPYNLGRDRQSVDCSVKPGHWTAGVLVAKANLADFSGQLGTEPFDLPDVPYRLASTRPIVLPKQQPKTIDTLFFVPAGYSQQPMSTQLLSRRGSQLARFGQTLNVIPAHQFFFVVLARAPDRYAYLKGLDAVRAPSSRFGLGGADNHYQVVLPRIRTRAPLAGNPLAWTGIAYVLWDNLEPSALTLAQQAALVDWLHWGGQLIVNGPNSLSGLAGSFLEPYLPATSAGALPLTAGQLTALAEEGSPTGTLLPASKPWEGVLLTPRADAEVALATAAGIPLVVERRVGSGRVVTTAFHLGERQLVDWDGIDPFLNRFILRRPGRTFVSDSEEVTVQWQGELDERDSRLVSRLRYFSRDAEVLGVATDPVAPAPENVTQSGSVSLGRGRVPNQPKRGNQLRPFDPNRVPRNVATWNDQSDVAELTRQAVREATRIEIPNADFVVRMLVLYLLVLVPLNWLVFRAIGRVEWAWIAAPLIALLGAVVVVRAAQLDIGFVRAKNELAMLELYADHPRAHLTRYTCLYTSLSTNYDMHYADPSAVAQPFPLGMEILYGQGRTDLELHRDDAVVLRRVPVASNSIGVVHSEQMFELGGAITAAPDPQRPGAWRVTNGTSLVWKGTGLVQPDGAAWIGTLAPGQTVTVEFNQTAGSQDWKRRRRQALQTADRLAAAASHLGPLLDFAEAERPASEWRLVAWTDQELPGVTIVPRAAQSQQATVIVAHLRPAAIPLGQRDLNSRGEVETQHDKRRLLREEVSDCSGPAAPPPSATVEPQPPSASGPP